MTTSTPLSGVQKMALGRIKSLQRSIGIGLFLLFGWSGSLWAGIINVPGNQPTIAAAISVAVAGDVIMVAPGTYVITSQINLNKDVTIDGGDKTTTKIQGNFSVGTYFVLISGAGANATIQNITFEKTDKTGEQNLIGLQANGVTFDNCVFQGQYILDDPDVSRAFEVAGSTTGFLINDCTIKNLRQPGYLNPNCAGQITNCYVDQTRGWVLDGGTGSNVQFNGNTWGNNAFDIAILNGTSLGAPYDPLEDLVANNGGASISDQRSYKAYNITKDLSYNAATAIQDAINAADPADEIQIRMGTHNETITVSEEVTLIGSGNGSDPSSNTVIKAATACTGTAFTISANNVTLKNMHIKDYATGVQLSAVNNAALEDLAIEDHCTYGINFAGSLAEEIDIKNTSINRTGAPGTSVGLRAGTASGVDGLLVDGCIITNNYQGISVFQATTPVAFTDITIQNSTISNNAIKGMYFEKLDNALLKGLTMDNNGTDVTYGFNNGIDINLKYDDYSNITIENCDITNSGVTGTAADPENPAAVAIKARDDAPSYNLNPATLTDVVIKNSRISGPQNGIRFGEFGKINATPSNITLTNNNLGHGFAHKELISRINNDITLNCNWHGSTDVPTITGRFVTAGSGGIDLNQFLDTNTDGNPAVGFQPSGVCICPSGLLVTNDNTNVTYCTIQEAVDAATAGDKLIASPGTFTENVTINKALILEGSNAGISCGDPMRGAESVISPASGVPFTVTASGVTINGFEITGAASANAIVCGNTSDLNIQYNNIHDIGTTVNGSHVHAINYTVANSPAATEDVLIADNCFDNIGNFSNHQRSTSAIGILQSTSTGTLTGLTIERNTITNVKAKNVAWTLGGRIANGITINVGGNANFLLNGKVVNAMIRNNEITNLEGFIATGIGLEGNTENGVVENNLVLNLTGYKNDTRANGGFDLSGLKFENNRYVNTCTVE
ncbi:MAG: right-handed parallel beta-helix repeat-containing protein, partial [Saprospiraceae bacterium]|nr:right-handed parallel beta-helix repeat-containing protein [Saprospiraceae bacterium]